MLKVGTFGTKNDDFFDEKPECQHALASNGGTNLQALIDGSLDAEIKVVISNNSRSLALERARRVRIPTAHLSSMAHSDSTRLDAAIADTLTSHGVELVALAGYMRKQGLETLRRYRNRILNIHPALLPNSAGRECTVNVSTRLYSPQENGYQVSASILWTKSMTAAP